MRADSGIVAPADLPGRRLGGPTNGVDGSLMNQLCASMAHLHFDPPIIEVMGYSEATIALGRGEIDMTADYVDLLPRLRREAGVPLRAIPVGIDVYASGLVAADRLPLVRVMEMRAAIVAALERQRREPRAWLSHLLERWPEQEPDDVLESWALVSRNRN